MTALMTIWTEERSYTQCNSACYSATSKNVRCTCLCGGMNHKVGYEQAVANTKLHWKEWLATFMEHSPVYNFEVGCL